MSQRSPFAAVVVTSSFARHAWWGENVVRGMGTSANVCGDWSGPWRSRYLEHRLAAHTVKPLGIDLALLHDCNPDGRRSLLAPSGRLLGRAGRGRAGIHHRSRRSVQCKTSRTRCCNRQAARWPCTQGTNPPEREAEAPEGELKATETGTKEEARAAAESVWLWGRLTRSLSDSRHDQMRRVHRGVVDIRGRRDFSRFDPSPGEASL